MTSAIKNHALGLAALCAAMLISPAARAQDVPAPCLEAFAEMACIAEKTSATEFRFYKDSGRVGEGCVVLSRRRGWLRSEPPPGFVFDSVAAKRADEQSCPGFYARRAERLALQDGSVPAATAPAPGAAAPGRPAPAPKTPAGTVKTQPPVRAQPAPAQKAPTVERALDAYFATGNRAAEGVAQSGSVLVEASQILGQIVLERGSNAALALAQRRLGRVLRCSKLQAGAGSAGASSGKGKDATQFARTCEVLAAINLPDIPAAADVLKNAVIADLVEIAWARVQRERTLVAVTGSAELDARLGDFLELALRELIWPAYTGQRSAFSTADTNLLMIEVLRWAQAAAPELVAQMQKERERIKIPTALKAALVSAAAAYAQCASTASADLPLESCVMELYVNRFMKELGCDARLSVCGRAYRLAEKLASHMQQAGTLLKDDKRPDPQGRAHQVVDFVFETLLFALEQDAKRALQRERLEALQRLTHAIIDRDGSAIVVAGSGFIQTIEKASERRAFRLIVRLLQAGEAYVSLGRPVPEGDAEGEAARVKARRQLIEGLIDDFTDRSSRGGELIIGAGGALRGVLGVYTDAGDHAFVGPLSLTLGFALQKLPEADGAGIHLELGIVDLGRYIALKDGTVVEPEADALLAPSISVGACWGQDFPFYIAFTGGYAPTYRRDENDDNGAWTIGAAAGVYVPLIDFF